MKVGSLFYVNASKGCVPDGISIDTAISAVVGQKCSHPWPWTECLREEEPIPHHAWVTLIHKPRESLAQHLSLVEGDEHVLAYTVHSHGDLEVVFPTIILPTDAGALRAFKAAERHFEKQYNLSVDEWNSLSVHDRKKPCWENANFHNHHAKPIPPWDGDIPDIREESPF
jgi:hypothetical protein